MSARKRMTVDREWRWYLAVKLLGWAFDLINAEATDKTLLAFNDLFASLGEGNDPAFNTVPMRDRK